jgi:ppGpp synthetase/RelA/SpoT-type nucleotidyltranferase
MIFKLILRNSIFLVGVFMTNIMYVTSFVTNANLVIQSEQKSFNEILNIQNLPCHLQTARVKTFESAMEKIKRNPNIENIYDLPDLIGFRFVFYTKDDLLKFYHHLRLEKTFTNSKNYIMTPKENGYKSWHIRYKNEYPECPLKQLECQMYIINDYYNALYGNAKRIDKNYTLYF